MKYLKLLLLSFLISACASDTVINATYSDGMKNLKIGNYKTAAEIFEKIEDTQPFTQDATNGLIMSSYSYYKAKQYEDSIRVIDYFIQSNPIDENLSYMHYLRSLNFYDRVRSMRKARDLTEMADSSLKETIYRYPDTSYAKDSEIRLKKTESYLSGNEMSIANYYLRKKNYIGASNHFIKVLNNYPNSKFVPEALYRLIEINSFLNLKLEAVQYYKLLTENYKDSVWIKYSTKIIKQYEKK